MNLLQPSFVGIVGINTRALKLHQWLGFKVFKMSHYVFISPFKKKFKIIKFKNLSKISLKNKRIFKTKFIEVKKSNINKLINNDFYKKISRFTLTKKGIEVIGRLAITLAEYENLHAHALSIKSRY